MKISSNISFQNIYKLFDDIEYKYNIVINDIEKRKMIVDICNLLNREVLGLDELETYIIRCRYGIYSRSVESSYECISNNLGYDINKIKVYNIKALNKIYEYILRNRKIMKYGDNSIYSLDNISYFMLEKMEYRGIVYIDDLLKLDKSCLFELFKELRMYLVPMFDYMVVYRQAYSDLINFIRGLDINSNKCKVRVNNK